MNRLRGFLDGEKGFVCLWIILSIIGTLMQMLLCSPYFITYDSAYQYALTSHSFPEIFALLPEDYSPPLYAVLLKLVNLITGENLFYYRLFNALPFSGMLYLSLFPVRKNFGKTAGLLSAVLVFCSVINIWLFNEIRPTYLAYFLVSGLVIYGFQAFFSGGKPELIKFTVFAILCMYTHNIALVAAFGVYLTCLFSALCTKNKKKFLKFLLSGIVSLLIYLPWLLILLKQMQNVRSNFWDGISLTPVIFKTLVFDSISHYQDNLFLASVIDMLPRIAVLLILLRYFRINPKASAEEVISEIKKGWMQCRSSVFRYAFLLLELLIPILVFAVINETFHKLATDRYFFIFTGTAIFIMAVSVAKAGKRLLTGLFCGFVLLNLVFVYPDSMKTKNTDYQVKNMIQEIREENPDGEIAFVHIHEWSIGIMSYLFPEAKHYIYDDTWTILNDMSVFPAEIISIGNLEHLPEYTTHFYLMDQSFFESGASFDFDLFDGRIETVSQKIFLYRLYNTRAGSEKMEIKEVRITK